MGKSAFFNKLFIFEIANNHMGSLDHGLRIIREIGRVTGDFDFKFGFKLQYRDLETFIHPDFKGSKDLKYVKRFEETRLEERELKVLKDEIKHSGFLSICTPFDENSVDLVEKHGFDIIKIGSCSFNDWPLLERIAGTDKPVILSAGGASVEDVDKVVAFLEHRKKIFCLMHCVSEYPADRNHLRLSQIDFMRQRYPGVAIGYSTHEGPDNLDAVKIAIGEGATVFERHVGVETGAYKLNNYSSGPGQIRQWLSAAKEAFAICGIPGDEGQASAGEKDELRGLQRGVFARRTIKADEKIGLCDVFFAIPNLKGQLLANDFSKYTEFISSRTIRENKPVMFADVKLRRLRGRVPQILSQVRKLLVASNTHLPLKADLELSHHYGIDNFEKFGATIINCINREYCKKLIIVLPGQAHPLHYHKKKEETFHVLYGDIRIKLNGTEKDYKAGDMVIVERNTEHSFSSKNGAVFEEISTMHFAGDSYYADEQILENKNRKTELTFWSDWLAKPAIEI
ncbi:MAG: N-acetylneuraminate synthase family protein [Candidatus Omnitrophica bacterium]|nr:N-acetylneuraminate synthase family protein [Candidatus Omnitrophota bacterium]